jgi:hypothetical protein
MVKEKVQKWRGKNEAKVKTGMCRKKILSPNVGRSLDRIQKQ